MEKYVAIILNLNFLVVPVALFRLWDSPQKVLWWAILLLFVFGWLSGQTVKTAISDGDGLDVARFWTYVYMGVKIVTLVLAGFGIYISFN